MVEKTKKGRVEVASEEKTAEVANEDKGPNVQVLKEHLGPSAQVVAMVVLAPEVTPSPSEGETGTSTLGTSASLTPAL